MTRTYREVAGLAALVVALFISSSAFAASGTCRTTQIAFNQNAQANVSTDSATFVDLPNTTVAFTQTVMGCVVVQLTIGETSNSLTSDLRLRAKLIGSPIKGYPGEVTMLSYNGGTLQFLFADVPPGSYTATIQFRSDSGTGYDVFVSRTLTVVNYR